MPQSTRSPQRHEPPTDNLVGALLPEELVLHLGGSEGVLTRAQANALGVSDNLLADLSRQSARITGPLLRVGRVAYVDRALHDDQTTEARHALRARAISTTLPEALAVSHYSAACLLGLPFIGRPPHHVHFSRRGPGQHRRTRHYTVHTAYPQVRSHRLAGVRLVDPAQVVLGVADLCGLVQAVATTDAEAKAVSQAQRTASRRP